MREGMLAQNEGGAACVQLLPGIGVGEEQPSRAMRSMLGVL